MIRIKPHHFLDIIKLYGKGIKLFVPDEKYRHNFYGIANQIINDHEVEITITSGADDICAPCIYLGLDKRCTDVINHINNIRSKNDWNLIIDQRIMNYTNIREDNRFSAQEFCKILFDAKESIFDIWNEEPQSAKEARYQAFCTGAKMYLNLS